MISVNLPKSIEKRFWDIVEDDYGGDVQTAIRSFLKLHERYGWKELLREDIASIRLEVNRSGGIKASKIEEAIKKYRKDATCE